MMTALRTGALLVLGAIVAAGAGELAARLDDAIRLGIPLESSPSPSDLIMQDSIGTRGRPLASYQKWRMNAVGFRGQDIPAQPTSNCTRVAVMGASETFGYYESPGKEYPAQLADSLHASGCYDVINAGLVGITIPKQVQLWENWLSRFNPRIVVIYAPPVFYLANDPPKFTPPFKGSDELRQHFASRLLDRLHERISVPEVLQRRRVERTIANAVRGKSPDWFFRDVPEERVALFRSHLDSLVTSIRAHGAVPVLATHAMRFGNPPTTDDQTLILHWRQFTPRATETVLLDFERQCAAAVRALARERQVPLVDVASVMTGHTEWFADFTHFDDVGAGVIAGNIARVVEGLGASHAQASVAASLPATLPK